MNAKIKSWVRAGVRLLVKVLAMSRPGRYVYGQIVDQAMALTRKVSHGGHSLTLAVPNGIAEFRANTFSTKEPETLEWIESMPRDSVVWDIGANVGLYTCYAAVARGSRVFAFEPSVFNLELLARNIFLNGVQELVTIVPLPLSDKLEVNQLNMSSKEWGEAQSTFGRDYGQDGQEMDKVFSFSTLGLSMADAVALLQIPAPQFIKIDVDGIEHLILRGGDSVLAGAESVLIEINDDFLEQAESARTLLERAGLRLAEKRRWSGTHESPFASTYNQIWRRGEAHTA